MSLSTLSPDTTALTKAWAQTVSFYAGSVLSSPSPGAPFPATPHNIGHICPITREPIDALEHVVLAEDNYLYEREALKTMLTLSPRSPISRCLMTQTSAALLGVAAEPPLSRAMPFSRLDPFEVVALYCATAAGIGAAAGTITGDWLRRQCVLVPPQSTLGVLQDYALASTLVTMGAAGGVVMGLACLYACLYGVERYLQPLSWPRRSMQ